MLQQLPQSARSTSGQLGWSMTKTSARKQPATQPSCGCKKLTKASTNSASWHGKECQGLVSDLPEFGSLFRQLAGKVKHQCLSQVTSLQAPRRLCLQANFPQVQQERQRAVRSGVGAAMSTYWPWPSSSDMFCNKNHKLTWDRRRSY